MYLPDLLNSRGFFSRCATLWEDPAYGDQVSELLARATSAVVGLLRIEELQRQCFWEFDLFAEQLPDIESRIVFNSSSVVALQNEISPILSALRMMQDHFNGIASRLFDAGLPRSINDTIKKLDARALPDPVKKLYRDYWDGGGSRIRDYRVLDQHYGTVSDHVFLQATPTRQMLILFPDNPEEKSRKKQTFSQEVCGISVLRVGFDEIHEFIESILEFKGIAEGSLKESISLDQWGDLRPFRKRELGLLYQSRIQEIDGRRNLDVSALRFGQLPDGRVELQKLLVSPEKLEKINQGLTP